jgi:hypothetical protein
MEYIMADEKDNLEKATKKKLQAELVQAVKSGDFKKSARLRKSIANLK